MLSTHVDVASAGTIAVLGNIPPKMCFERMLYSQHLCSRLMVPASHLVEHQRMLHYMVIHKFYVLHLLLRKNGKSTKV